jgi:hypothetical protein
MTVVSTVEAKDRAATARARLAELRADPEWVAQRARGTKLSRRFAELCEQFAAEVGDAGLTATGKMLVQQAASLSLRCEQLQSDLVRGKAVDVDTAIRLTSEVRRILATIRSKPATKPTVSALDEYLSREEAAP